MSAHTEETAFRSFLRLQGARSPCNGVVVAWLYIKLRKQATRRYSRAISHSIKCDDRILIFASHAIDLTRALKEDYLYGDIVAFTFRMRREIQCVLRAAESNTFDFIAVRTSLGLLKTVAYSASMTTTFEGFHEKGVSLRQICLNRLVLWFDHRCTGDCFTESQLLKDTIDNLICCIDALIKRTVCDWSLVGQELTRLQDDIAVHKSTLSDVQVPERWASMAKERWAHASELRKLQDFYPDVCLNV